jgi:hypothetical protein
VKGWNQAVSYNKIVFFRGWGGSVTTEGVGRNVVVVGEGEKRRRPLKVPETLLEPYHGMTPNFFGGHIRRISISISLQDTSRTF